jgi:hypothetical protein
MEVYMPEKKQRSVSPYSGGAFQGLANRIKLIMRLMGDSRVSPLLKLIPVVSLVYLVFPDIAPGPIDDAAVIWISTYLFVEMCPPQVVKEHQDSIEGTGSPNSSNMDMDPNASFRDEDIIDGEIVSEEYPEKK